jgi:hypothetical protein
MWIMGLKKAPYNLKFALPTPRFSFPPPEFPLMPLIKKDGLRGPYFYMNFPPPTLKNGTGNEIRTLLKVRTTKAVAEKVRDARSVLFLNRNRALAPLLISTFLGFEK